MTRDYVQIRRYNSGYRVYGFGRWQGERAYNIKTREAAEKIKQLIMQDRDVNHWDYDPHNFPIGDALRMATAADRARGGLKALVMEVRTQGGDPTFFEGVLNNFVEPIWYRADMELLAAKRKT